MTPEAEVLSAEDALRHVQQAAGMRVSLRTRIEGMSWILWGCILALQALTWYAVLQLRPAQPAAWLAASTLAWYALGSAASVGIWRAVAMHVDTRVGRTRALAFFIAWPILFILATHVASTSTAVGYALAAGVLLLVFASANPVDFTRSGRLTAVALGIFALAAAGVVAVFGATGAAWYGITGASIGASWLVAGIILLYRG